MIGVKELPPVLKVAEASKVLGVSEKTLYKLTKQKGFPAVRLGEKRIVIPSELLLQWMSNQVT